MNTSRSDAAEALCNKERSAFGRAWDTVIYRFLSGTAKQLARLDFKGIHTLSHGLGATLWATLPRRRDLATNNIAECLGLSHVKAREIARESFNHTAMSFLESVLAPHFGINHPLLHIANPPLFEQLRTTPRAVVATTAHLGAWELEAGMLGEFRPAHMPRMVVVRRYGNDASNRLMNELRQGRGAQVLGHREATSGVLRALKKKGLVAFLVDHNTSQREAVFLPFLGKIAAVNKGPALLAVRGEALIWPVALLRDGERYVTHLEKPLDTLTLTGDHDEKILVAAKFYTEAIERLVLRAPEQWFWMHNRWKTQDDGTRRVRLNGVS